MKNNLNAFSCLTVLFCFIFSNLSAQACDYFLEDFTVNQPPIVMFGRGLHTFNIIAGDIYTTVGDYGNASPSIKMDATGDIIDILVVEDGQPSIAKSLQFWIKGIETNATSALSIDGANYDGGGNIVLTYHFGTISPIPTTGTIIRYNLITNPGGPFPTPIIRLRYTQSLGEVAVDDICISASVLPIEIMSFGAKKEGNAHKLMWQTTYEANNARFDIERSMNGSGFEKIGEVKGAGNSTQLKDYSFVDERPLTNANYYRLRQVDFGGIESLSNIVALNFTDKISKIKLYPTLSNDIVNIEMPSDMPTKISVSDMLGKVVLVKNTEGGDKARLSLMTLTDGFYVVTVQTNQVLETFKVQKQH